jgi:hypothetical protein
MGSQVHYLPLTPGLFSIMVLLVVGLIVSFAFSDMPI